MTYQFNTVVIEDHNIQLATDRLVTWVSYPDYLEAVQDQNE